MFKLSVLDNNSIKRAHPGGTQPNHTHPGGTGYPYKIQILRKWGHADVFQVNNCRGCAHIMAGPLHGRGEVPMMQFPAKTESQNGEFVWQFCVMSSASW